MAENNARSFSVGNPTRLFSLETDNYKILKTEETQQANLPLVEKKDLLISPVNRSHTSVRSIDHRIKEAIKPVMENMEVLRPHTFNTLLNETHSVLAKEVAQIEAAEIRESVVTLIQLLKENADLVNLFQRYTNWLQKA